MSIPKIIHLIWVEDIFNPQIPQTIQYPSEYNSNVKSIIDNNKDYQVKFWDKASIVRLMIDSGYMSKYCSFDILHQRIDFARYVILYTHGGISVDLDVVAHKSFNETPGINEYNFIVSKNSTSEFVNNATILVSKNNPLMKQWIEEINTECSGSELERVQSTTGPLAFTRFVNKNPEIEVLPNIYLEPCSGWNHWCKLPKETIIDHQHMGSWLSPAHKYSLQVGYFIKEHKLLIAVILIVILIIVFRRYL